MYNNMEGKRPRISIEVSQYWTTRSCCSFLSNVSSSPFKQLYWDWGILHVIVFVPDLIVKFTAYCQNCWMKKMRFGCYLIANATKPW